MKRAVNIARVVPPLLAGVVLLGAAGVVARNRTAAPPPAPAAALPPPASEETLARQYAIVSLAAKQRPNDAVRALEAGALAGDMGRAQEALDWFRKAAALDPKLLPAITGQGQMWMQLGRPGPAVPQFRKALRLSPDQPQILLELARAYSELRDFGEALRTAQQAEKLTPSDPAVFRALAQIHAETLNPDPAFAAITRACELEPDNPENWVTRGSLLLRSGRYAEAETMIRRALALAPADATANLLCARALVEGRKTPEADREAFGLLARARLSEPDDPEMLRIQGEILVRAGQVPLAVGLLRQAREAAPEDSRVLLALGQALVRSGKTEEGVRITSQSQKLGPRGVSFLDLENLARTDPTPSVTLRLARLDRRQKRHDAAIHALERALRRTPGAAELRKELAVARREAGDGSPGAL
jgi:tetratricopeptide (TPR) repeat protein